MSRLHELEELFNEMIRPLDQAHTIVDVMIEGDLVEMVDELKIQKLIGIIQMLLTNTYLNAEVLWNEIETDHSSKLLCAGPQQ